MRSDRSDGATGATRPEVLAIAVTLTVGADTFSYEGREEDAYLFLRIWLHARRPVDAVTQDQIDKLTARSKASTDKLRDAVDTHTP